MLENTGIKCFDLTKLNNDELEDAFLQHGVDGPYLEKHKAYYYPGTRIKNKNKGSLVYVPFSANGARNNNVTKIFVWDDMVIACVYANDKNKIVYSPYFEMVLSRRDSLMPSYKKEKDVNIFENRVNNVNPKKKKSTPKSNNVIDYTKDPEEIIDDILDKIGKYGKDSLTKEELAYLNNNYK